MGTSDTTLRRFRVNRGFGRAPRFVLAASELHARLVAWRMTHALLARLEHAA